MWQRRFAEIVECNSQTGFEVERIHLPESWFKLSVNFVLPPGGENVAMSVCKNCGIQLTNRF
jgi:hypothetical protein